VGYRVTLRRPLEIAGSIVDAETSQPLTKCSLIKGWPSGDGRNPQWETSIGYPATTIFDGRYEVSITQSQSMLLRVEADGYMPAVSRVFEPSGRDKGHVTHEFRLHKAAPLSGIVVGADGRPLADADVYLAIWQFNVVGRKSATNWINHPIPTAKTDTKGRFELPPEVEPFSLVVLHPQGYAKVTEEQFARTRVVRIEPWKDGENGFMIER
jgi:hypothetical protein